MVRLALLLLSLAAAACLTSVPNTLLAALGSSGGAGGESFGAGVASNDKNTSNSGCGSSNTGSSGSLKKGDDTVLETVFVEVSLEERNPTTAAEGGERHRSVSGTIPNGAVFGLSIEYHGAKEVFGRSRRSARLHARLLTNLVKARLREGGGSEEQEAMMVIRIGGNSADRTCYVPSSSSSSRQGRSHHPLALLPKGCAHSYRLTDRDLFNLQYFADNITAMANLTAAATFVLDTNMGLSPDPNYVATALVRRLSDLKLWNTYVSGIEIGNEVNFYGGPNSRFRRRNHSAAAYGYNDYENEFGDYIQAYKKAGMPKILQGGTFSLTSREYAKHLPRYLTRFRGDLKTISYHHYAVSQTKDAIAGGNNHVDKYIARLLGRDGVQQVLRQLEPILNMTRNIGGVPLVLGETNSINHGGMRNVSDTFASALWVLDYLATLSEAGVEQILLHAGTASPGTPYTPFAYDPKTKQIQVRPLYYGLLMFGELVSQKSQWLFSRVVTYPDRQKSCVVLERENESDPLCQNGIPTDHGVCCSVKCGICGGDDCAFRPGGRKACCGTAILKSAVSCDDAMAPCVVNPSSPSDPIVVHATYRKQTGSVRVLLLAKRFAAHGNSAATAAPMSTVVVNSTVNVCLPRYVAFVVGETLDAACPMKTSGRLVRLTAPSIHSTFSDDILLGGQTFRNTSNGLPVGSRHEEVIPCTIDAGRMCFVVAVPSLSAALLTVKVGQKFTAAAA